MDSLERGDRNMVSILIFLVTSFKSFVYLRVFRCNTEPLLTPVDLGEGGGVFIGLLGPPPPSRLVLTQTIPV